jgi:hypothetical protein
MGDEMKVTGTDTPHDQFGTTSSCVRGCCPDQKTHFKSIQLGKVERSEQWKAEKRWEKEHAAYRRLRKDGLQPKSLSGADELEQRAESKLEVEMGKVFDGKKAQTSARIGTEISQELGLVKE